MSNDEIKSLDENQDISNKEILDLKKMAIDKLKDKALLIQKISERKIPEIVSLGGKEEELKNKIKEASEKIPEIITGAQNSLDAVV